MKHLAYILPLLFLLSSCGASKQVSFKEMTNVKFKTIEKGGQIKITADAVMHNPRRIKAKVAYMECDVYVDGKPLAEVMQVRQTKVPRRSDFSIPLEASISLKKVIGNAVSLAKSLLGDGRVKIKLDGVVKVKVLGKTFTVPFVHEEETEVSF